MSTQASIPAIGKVEPIISRLIESTFNVFPHLAMTGRLVLFPHGSTSTMVWDMENDRALGVLEGHTFQVMYAAADDTAVTIADDDTYAEGGSVKIWSLDTMQCKANLTST